MASLGRFQLGGVVPLGVACVDGGGLPATPDAAPTATITGPGGYSFGPVKMAMNKRPTAFLLPLRLGDQVPLGTFSVAYSYSVGAFHGIDSDTFNVIAGGDLGGAVIGIYAYDRPEATYVVAQLDSGNLVQGRNPRL